MSSSESKKLHILIVDDEVTIARLASRILRAEGYEVIVANTVAEARGKIESMLANGGLHGVLTDWDIAPDGMNAGAHVLAAAKEAGVEALIAMSGRLNFNEVDGTVDEDEVKIAMRNAGAMDFLAKPFGRKQVIDAVRGVLEAQHKKEEAEIK